MSQAEPEVQAEKLPSPEPEHFSFRRMSGLDQIELDSDYAWKSLDKLDPKLWMALSCPTAGLEFSAATLELLDTDNDGRIRAQEVKEAVAWVCQRVCHPAELVNEKLEASTGNLRDDTPEGQALISALRLVLQKNGKPLDAPATLDEIEAVVAEASGYAFNGDGIVPPASAASGSLTDARGQAMREYIATGLALIGGKKDASGQPGLDSELNTALQAMLKQARDWRQELKAIPLPLGNDTSAAWALIQRVRERMDDYFNRCHLAEFAPEAVEKLNGHTALVAEGDASGSAVLDPALLLSLPLSKVSPAAVLNIQQGLNPAWESDIQEMARLAAPLIGASGLPASLSEDNWKKICAEFAPYAALLDKKPSYSLPPADAEKASYADCPELALAPAGDALGRTFLPLQPNETLDQLPDEKLYAMLAPETDKDFASLVASDKSAPPLDSFKDLRKLTLFNGNLYTFLRNFLSFMDFYDPEKKAIFQAGVLYLDSRSCLLCVPVDDIDAHARLAEQSHLCLIYCACTRKAQDGSEEQCTIAAALTEGNLASLIDGRHGLFIDNHGREWDSQIARVVHNPISMREAMWAPYIRLYNMAGEQIQKFIASKNEKAAELTQGALNRTAEAATPDAPKKESFDFAKGAGIFAALSVAISMLSAALAYIANSFLSLGWWWPVALFVIFLCISGPSMLLAWFKLRRRSLGPLLDASGWAVNKGAPINLAMGAALTAVGKLPPNAQRNLNDPYGLPAIIRARRKRMWFWFWFIVICIVLILGCIGWWALFGLPQWANDIIASLPLKG